MNYIKLTFIVLLYSIYIISGGILFYQHITVGLGMEIVVFTPVFIIASIISFFIPLNLNFSGISKYFNGLVIWLILNLLTSLVLLSYNYSKNYSEDILIAEFYWDSGIKIFLRENMSYKSENSDLLSGSVSYGEYRIQDNLIIFDGELRIGNSIIKDTLILNQDSTKLQFKLYKPWKTINSGELWIIKDYIFKNKQK